MKRIRNQFIALAVLLTLFTGVLSNLYTTFSYAAEKKTVKVSTKKGLNDAINDETVTDITFSTKRKRP